METARSDEGVAAAHRGGERGATATQLLTVPDAGQTTRAPGRPTAGANGRSGWPCRECGQRNDWAGERCSACGATFLDPLTEQPGAQATRLAALLAMPRAGRLGLAGAAAVGGIVILLVVATVLSWLVS
ncbi:MAG: hypothetical protein ACYDB7_07285 [Mycobacteriales bacterium]